MPLILIFLIQDFLFFSNSHWLFIAPFSAYILFGLGMMWIALSITFLLIIKSKFEFKFFRLISFLLVSISIPFFILGSFNYYYIDNEGIHYNQIKSLNVTFYPWSELKELKEVYSTQNGRTNLTEYIFVTKDDSMITLPFESELVRNEERILKKLKESGVKVTNNYHDLLDKQRLIDKE